MDSVQQEGLGDCIEPVISHQAADEKAVPLFREPIIVLVIGATAGGGKVRDSLLPEADEVGN